MNQNQPRSHRYLMAKVLAALLTWLVTLMPIERLVDAAPRKPVQSAKSNAGSRPIAKPPRPIEPVPRPAKPDQDATTTAASNDLDEPELNGTSSWTDVIRSVLLTAIPDKHEDRKHWGKQRVVFDGVRVQQRGVHLQVSERRKLVNDGAWHKYRIELPRPEERLQLTLSQIHSEGPGTFSCAVHVVVKPRCTAWFEQWVLGVKGLHLKVVSDATVHVYATCRLAIRTEFRPNSLLPDVVLEPSLESLKLRLTDIETHSIGVIGGDVAEELGNGSRRFLADLLKDREAKVLKKVNAAIAKKRDALRLSPSFGGGKSNHHEPTVNSAN